jgi:rhamnosyltransferase
MKIIAVVVTYFPELKSVVKNINQYIDYVDRIIIWENTPIENRSLYKIEIPEYQDKIIYLGTDKNEGIAFALNKSTDYALSENFTHILTMDQDSFFPDLTFKKFKEKAEFLFNSRDIAIITSNPNEKIRSNFEFIDVDDCITSGTFYDLSTIKKLGYFKTDFFIDAVDLEFNYRAKKFGYRTILIPDCILNQVYANYQKTFIGVNSQNYPVFRTYYIVRNHIIVWKEYPSFFNYKSALIKYFIIYRILSIIFGEKDKMLKIKALFFGISDGIRNRYIKRKFLL